jgi:flagellin-like protein
MEEEKENMNNQKTVQKFRKNAKAISPLIATLLLIAIAVAASVITYSWVMSMIGSQSQQAQTQVRIDSVVWDLTSSPQTIIATVRNTGSVPASIETISVRLSASGSTWYATDVSTAMDAGDTTDVTWDGTVAGHTLLNSQSYVIRVTCSTGFYYEMTTVSPAAAP